VLRVHDDELEPDASLADLGDQELADDDEAEMSEQDANGHTFVDSPR
jgi:hypothetical protein